MSLFVLGAPLGFGKSDEDLEAWIVDQVPCIFDIFIIPNLFKFDDVDV